MAHALALVLLGILELQWKRKLRFPRYAFGLGILIFSGSLYALALSGIRILGAITPIGGILFLLGWLSLAWTAAKKAKS
jgi:uncharacterized membrane protein YgdD (TMEM256/DUF423 family)